MKNKIFKLDLQFFATSGSAGKLKNKKYLPIGKRLGTKKFSGESVLSGNIIHRQRGMRIKAGENVGIGKDFTLFSKAEGKVKFWVKKGKKIVSVVEKE